MHSKFFARCASIAIPILAISTAPARAEVKLPPIFSDHMVLQRDMAVPVWGTASPGEKVTVTFRDQTKLAVAGPDGAWKLKLDPLKAGGPDTLEIKAGGTLTVNDVLVGEVWVGSGQSNMAYGVDFFAKADPVLAAAAAGSYPQLRMAGGARGQWKVATPETSAKFSAQLFYFGLRLRKELNVPVGLIVGAVGSTPSGNWLSPAMFEDSPACMAGAAKADAAYNPEEAAKQYDSQMEKWQPEADRARAANKPEPWGKPAKTGTPAEERAKVLGRQYGMHIAPIVPFGIRGVLWDQGENGTAVGGVSQSGLMEALISGWRKAWGQGDFAFIYVQKPSGRGCAFDPTNPLNTKASAYAPLPDKPTGETDKYLQYPTKVLDLPNTAMTITSDLGGGLHPENKSAYATRDADVALGLVYGRKIEYYGPMYASRKIEGDKIRVHFTHIGKGLAFKHGEKLTGFTIAGKDRNYQWADARIEGPDVVLSCPGIKDPESVAYAWASRAPWANLFSLDGLPALPFRADSPQ